MPQQLNKIRIAIFAFLLLAVFSFGYFALAQSGSDMTGLNYAGKTGLGNEDPQIIIARIIQIALGFLGIIALVIILYAGYIWMTSQGNEEKISKAKAMLKNAAIGLAIIFSAFAIVSFILSALLGNSGGSGEVGGGGGGYGGSIGALGNGIIKSVYPEPNQKEVPRNTSIIVTFKEKIDPKTICQTTGPVCNGENIVAENVRIFKTNQKDSCRNDKGSIVDCDKMNITAVKAYSKDDLTFVFAPLAYLGSPTEYVWHSVDLSSGIKKADGSFAFGALSSGYEWQFEVSSKLDLVPPQVLSGGVFPAPDNEKDGAGSETPAAAATGKITVNAQPQVYVDSGVSAAKANGGSGPATISGAYNCKKDGSVTVSIDSNKKTLVSGVEGMVGGDDASDGKAVIGCGLTLNGTFSQGNSWTFTVTAEKQADTIAVGNINYVFVSNKSTDNEISAGLTPAATANNIRTALAINPDVSAETAGAIVTLTARVAGKNGNNINLSVSNNNAFAVSPMSGGADKISNAVVKGRKDKPRNAVIQINFNEAVNPMTASGKSEEVKDYIRVINLSDNNKMVAGKFEISNQYKTVEFISDEECGVNACGEKIYCLPANSNLKVELVAASLQTCGSSSDCASKNPFSTCSGGICQDTSSSTAPLNYPGAKPNLDGITDVCFNSLDGNRNGNAEGPKSFYDENVQKTEDGDSYKWSFFVSDVLDLTAPTIKSTDAYNGAVKVDLYKPIAVTFDKLMMSSRLSPGSVIINNGKEDILHQLINIRSFTNKAVGYWITNEGIDEAPMDGEPDHSVGYINHTDFSDQSSFRAQVGSGVRDIYQNCYKPCAGAACFGANGVTPASPSCCSGAPKASESCK